MGKPWVLPSFKQILIESCEEYVNTTDKGRNKACTALISHVAAEIQAAVDETNKTFPTDLDKAIRTWFGNEVGRYANGNGGQKIKDDTHGHLTSTKSWTALSICGKLYAQQISKVQKRLSGEGKKILAHYAAA